MLTASEMQATRQELAENFDRLSRDKATVAADLNIKLEELEAVLAMEQPNPSHVWMLREYLEDMLMVQRKAVFPFTNWLILASIAGTITIAPGGKTKKRARSALFLVFFFVLKDKEFGNDVIEHDDEDLGENHLNGIDPSFVIADELANQVRVGVDQVPSQVHV